MENLVFTSGGDMPTLIRLPQQSSRLPVAVLLAAAVLFTDAVNASTAFELQDAIYKSEVVSSSGGSAIAPDTSLPFDIALDFVLSDGAHFAGRALTTGGFTPTADVQISTLGLSGRALAQVKWEAFVTGGSEARIVPLIFSIVGEASQTGDSQAYAESRVSERGQGSFLVRASAHALRGTASDGYSQIATLPYFIDANGQAFEFEAIAQVSTLFSHASSAQAVADPGISIDPLWEFASEYTISYSANLFPAPSTVDAPQSLAMMSLALLALSIRFGRVVARKIEM